MSTIFYMSYDPQRTAIFIDVKLYTRLNLPSIKINVGKVIKMARF